MDFFQLQTEFAVDVPAEGGADEAGAEVVVAVFGVAKHDCEIFGDVLQKHMERMQFIDDGLVPENAVLEDVAFRFGVDQREVLRVSGTEELKRVLHDFFASELTAGQIVEDHLSVLLKECLSLRNSLYVGLLKLKPPVRFQSR